MAEVFGAVASGVGIASFVIQVASSLKKVKQFVDLMKDAPNQLRYYIETIEQLNKILGAIDQQSRQMSILSGQSAIISGSFDDCRKAAHDLSSIAEDLEREMRTHSTKGRIKFALKKQTLDSFRIRLEAAKTSVLLSQQLCLNFFQQNLLQAHLDHFQYSQQLQHDIREIKTIVQFPRQPPSTSTQHANSSSGHPEQARSINIKNNHQKWRQTSLFTSLFGSVYYSGQGLFGFPTKDSNADEVTIRICTPAWLFGKIYEINKVRDSWTCQFNLRSYNILPDDALVFDYAAGGDIEGLKRLFRSKQATPFDREATSGYTALHLAARYGHESVCQFLLEQGADAYALDTSGYNPLNELHEYTTSVTRHHNESSKVMRLLRMFIIKYQRDNLVDFGDSSISWHLEFGGGPTTLALALEQVYPPYYERPLEARLDFAIQLWGTWGNIRNPDHESFKLAITKGDIDPRCFHMRLSNGTGLISEILLHMAHTMWYEDGSFLDGWSSLLSEAVRSKVDLHRLDGIDSTMFQYFLFHSAWVLEAKVRFREASFFERTPQKDKLNAAVRKFLQVLHRSGVDLLAYGATEKQVHEDGYLRFESYRGSPVLKDRLIGFKYGASVDDWHIWVDLPIYQFAEDFWYMVENPWERIPGAWVDVSGASTCQRRWLPS